MHALNIWKTIGLVILVCLVAAIASPAQTFTTLMSFNYTNGADPLNARLVQGVDGNLYGTTAFGGTCPLYGLGCGTVFRITPGGAPTTLHYFAGPEGAFPYSGLMLGTDGNFYGTTEGGGANCATSNGCGTIYKITTSGKLSTLYSFCSLDECADGSAPSGGLVQGTDGNLYGTTTYGGASNNCSLGCGTIFKLTAGGNLTTLYSFTGPPGGLYPTSRLMQATDGNFYGTTETGGVNCCGAGWGLFFKITPLGTFTPIYSFCSLADCADGDFPDSGVIQARDGNFYGTTREGGNGSSTNCPGGCGTVFKITPGGSLTTLHNFSASTDGFSPSTGLIQAIDGNFYGTTVEGGYNFTCPGGCGNIFEMTPAGFVTNLYNLNVSVDGSDLISPLVQFTDGSFYGTTYVGGPDGAGTVFSLSTGLGSFVKVLPHSGKVGATIKILGTNLEGATHLSFNGTTAPFTVVSPSLITTSVPAGATTGKVHLTTSSGTLLSNVPFTVVP